MAKTGFFRGGQQAPNPQVAQGGGMFRRGPGGILPERGSQAQYDLVNAMLASGISSARDSGSPLLAFLAPMIGGAVGSRTQSLYDQAQAKRGDASTGTLLSLMGGDPRAAQLLGVLNDPNAYDGNKAIARTMLADVMKSGRGARGGGGRRRSSGQGGGSDALLEALNSGGTLDDDALAVLTRTMSNPNATTQSRALARDMLQRHYTNKSKVKPAATAPAPSVETAPPSLPITPLAQPAKPAGSNDDPLGIRQ